MTSVADILTGAVSSQIEKRGLRLVAKTNVTPAVVVYDAADKSPSLLTALGIKTHVSLQDANGASVAEYGDDAATDPVYAAVVWTALALTGFAVVAMLARLLKESHA